MLPGIHIRELEVFGHGFFQDVLTLMEMLDVEELTKKDLMRYQDNLLKHTRKKTTTKKAGKRKPCKGCKDKKIGG